jgi:hypothetical protein
MATDPLAKVRNEIGLRVAEIREAGPRLSPLDMHAKMDAIRQLAAINGLAALEGLARCSAQLALLPGHRVAIQTCLEHVDEALESISDRDRTTILAALAIRLH